MVIIAQVECMNLSCLCVQFSTFPSAFRLFVLSQILFFIQRLQPIFHLTSFSISSSRAGAILCSCMCGCAHATDVFKMTARLGCSVPALVGRQMVTCAWTCLHAHLFSWRSFRSHFQGAASRKKKNTLFALHRSCQQRERETSLSGPELYFIPRSLFFHYTLSKRIRCLFKKRLYGTNSCEFC